MVTRQKEHRRRGILLAEMAIALAIVAAVALPLGLSLLNDKRELRGLYFKAVAMEIVDGEMEILAAGQPAAMPLGSRPHAVNAAAAANLPPGQFILTRTVNTLRLEWRPDEPQARIGVARELKLP